MTYNEKIIIIFLNDIFIYLSVYYNLTFNEYLNTAFSFRISYLQVKFCTGNYLTSSSKDFFSFD